MKRRIPRRAFTMAASLLMLGASLFGAARPAAAAADPSASTGATSAATSSEDVSQVIFQGLWAGVNLDFDSIISSEAARQPSAQPHQASSTPQTPAAAGNYAALGDSVAAGLGLATPLSVPSGQMQCGRTAESYPVLVSKAMGMPLTDASCSGATAGDIITQQRSPSPNQAAQLDTAYASGTPGLITITAGANDVHWQDFLYTCYYTNCDTSTSSAAAAAYRSVLRAKLYAVFSSIQFRSQGHAPTVVYTGYYNPVSPACQGRIQNVTSGEISWFSDQVASLNKTIRDAASHYSFVRFVPVDFTGHDICSTNPWVQGLTDTAPIHPTAAGQRAIAADVLQSLGH